MSDSESQEAGPSGRSRAGLKVSGLPPFVLHPDPATVGLRWKRWRQKLECFFRIEQVTDQAIKRDHLIFNLSEDALDVFNGLEDTGNEDDYDTAIQAMEAKCVPQVNPDYEDFKLRQAMQKPKETIDDFHARLRNLAKTCEYQNAEIHIRSQLIYGISSEKLRRQIMAEPNIRLPRILDLGRQKELAEERAASMETALRKVKLEPKEETVKAVQRRRPTKQSDARKESPQERAKFCSHCGNKWHRRSECPAMGQECHNCGKMNHWAVACQTRETVAVKEEEKPQPGKKGAGKARRKARHVRDTESDPESDEEEDESEEEVATNRITTKPKRKAKIRLISSLSSRSQKSQAKCKPRCSLMVSDNRLDVIVDTGAGVNVLSRKTYEALVPKPELVPAKVILLAYGSSKPLPVLGAFIAPTTYGSITKKTRFHVVDKNTETLLGCRSALKLQLVKFTFDVMAQSLSDLIAKYPKLFQGIGCRKGPPVRLHIDPNVTPM